LHNPIKTFNARSLFLSTHPLFHLVRIRTKHGNLNLQGGKKQNYSRIWDQTVRMNVVTARF
jgi:hypothetical protein